MNKTQKADWATEADYEKAFAYIEEKKQDTQPEQSSESHTTIEFLSIFTKETETIY